MMTSNQSTQQTAETSGIATCGHVCTQPQSPGLWICRVFWGMRVGLFN